MTVLKFVQSVWQSFRTTSGLEPRLLDNLRVTAARPGVVNFELDIQKEHTNRLGILHGGTIASMVDLGGSLALASRGLFSTGVSTDLNGSWHATPSPGLHYLGLISKHMTSDVSQFRGKNRG
ncbi:hypothetical protein ACJ72_00011 [Emergomyces africanus]|uniref:Thioesterase domain-containing protein n=1 Tax=Emergomyces africanus TaxID=1955775 RepID=A0A1B7P9S2_9EURO|nr:hypothetical protein ACJ72_00011 [Emergomyces africanus]